VRRIRQHCNRLPPSPFTSSGGLAGTSPVGWTSYLPRRLRNPRTPARGPATSQARGATSQPGDATFSPFPVSSQPSLPSSHPVYITSQAAGDSSQPVPAISQPCLPISRGVPGDHTGEDMSAALNTGVLCMLAGLTRGVPRRLRTPSGSMPLCSNRFCAARSCHRTGRRVLSRTRHALCVEPRCRARAGRDL
jgi:hypothetical protein